MGCNVQCPVLPCAYREDWGIEDPSGKTDKEFRVIRNTIKTKMDDLVSRLRAGVI
jgi:arsenate reductase